MLQKLNVLNWRTKSATSQLFCSLQSQEKSTVPFDFSIGAIDETTMRLRLSAEPLRIIVDPNFLFSLVDFFSTSDTQWNEVWAFATTSVQDYVFAEQQADMLAAVSKQKDMTFDVLVDMKAPVFLLPHDANSDITTMLVMDFGHFHLMNVESTTVNVYSWQIDLTDIEVILNQPSSGGVSVVPRFSVGLLLDTIRRADGKTPVICANAKLPTLSVNFSQDTILGLGKMHASLLAQCKSYLQAPPTEYVDNKEAEYIKVNQRFWILAKLKTLEHSICCCKPR
ncbi:Aste57867_17292 [Aphanomyces stellatus]|uniref:Aste57867_17292 protein n=1 Tax=Aphanomyces stellatus TaxID=120398 RepID=A0A485L947_9STRA|nr:hypothetical protein As57867_017233 [Aphanomyces stellatus]VFT94048.1 Aste57867_17292 [Aphanomyces stellatus]